MSDDRALESSRGRDSLEKLGRAEREAQAEVPAEWVALAEGRADAAEVERLRLQSENDPVARELWARFRPLDAAFDDALAARLLAGRTPATVAAVVRGDFAGTARFERRWIAGAAVVLAVAAALLFAWMPRAIVLPPYALEVSSPDRAVRGSDGAGAGAQHLESALTLILRPGSASDAEVIVEAYRVWQGKSESWRPPMEISESGAIRIDGKIADLLPGVRGEVTLIFVVRPKSGAGGGQVLVHTLAITE